MIFVGIDPGASGAIAFINNFHSDLQPLTAVFDTPAAIRKANGKSRREYVISDMVDLVMNHAKDSCEAFAVIEKVGAMPGQGVTSMFNFGCGYGLWKGILGALQIPVVEVRPQTWKKEMQPDDTSKDAARAIAGKLFPSLADKLTLKKHDGRAEALLLAAFSRRLHERSSHR